MKSYQCLVALALGLGLALGSLSLLGSQNTVALADPGILYVAPGGDCGGATPCYATVQAAVDAASSGDEIRVAEGTYTGVSARAEVTQMVYISKTVAVRGGYTTLDWNTPDPTANQTTLNAQGQGRVLYITGDINPTVEGLRITGGDAAGLGGEWSADDAGAGVYVISATATISNNWVFENTADWGGGLYLLYSDDATLSGNTVISNTARWNGGGLCLRYSHATLSGNTVTANTAAWAGGGLCLILGDATLSGNTVTFNRAGGLGGGLFLYYSDATLSANVVTGNEASNQGGGLYLYKSGATLTNTVVADNQANTSGSGLYIQSTSPRLLHATIARNTGGDGSGVYITDDGSNYSSVAMTNTIIVSHAVGIAVTQGNTATLNATLWHGNGTDYSGNVIHTNDHSGDPDFDPDGYHLPPISAAIDAGVDAGVTTDIDGDPRPQGKGYDIGADEFRQWYIYLPLVMKNHAQ